MVNRLKYDPTYKPYDTEFHPQDLIERMSSGETNVQVLSAWNISEPTFYRWLKDHLELADAYDRGKTKFEAWYIENIFNPMISGKLQGRHSYSAAMTIAKNKLGWSKDTDRHANTTVNVQQLNVLNQKDPKELTEMILNNFDYLQNMNVIDVTPEPKLIESKDDSESDRKDKS